MGFADLERLIRPQGGERLRLGLRNLYILPTRFGWLWLAGTGLLQLVAIQSQRNGPLLLSFLMLGLWLLALHLTHFNLQGLELACLSPAAGFAEAPLTYPLLCRSRCSRDAVQLGFRGMAAAEQRLQRGDTVLALPWRPARRGLQPPGRLRIHTTAPLGLFVCWTLWEPPVLQAVIPARRPGPVALAAGSGQARPAASQGTYSQEGSETWQDLRPHRPQDSLARLAWKPLAQGRGRHSKRFGAEQPAAVLLAPAPGLPWEQALQHLSAEIWRRSLAGDAVGLVLGSSELPPASGPEQRDRCLLALALAPEHVEPGTP